MSSTRNNRGAAQGESGIKVLLFSDLFGSFADAAGSWKDCYPWYLRLREAGVEVVFITGAPVEIANKTLSGLEPRPNIMAGDGRILTSAEDDQFGPEGDLSAFFPAGIHPQRAAAEWVVDRITSSSRIVIPFGIGGSPDDRFLAVVSAGALIPSADGNVCPRAPRPEVAYVCGQTGQRGWNEWADLLLRRVELVSIPD